MTRSEWKRMRRWLFRFLLAEALLVGVFAWCCAQYITYEPEPEIFTVIRDVPVPVEITVAPAVSEEKDGHVPQLNKRALPGVYLTGWTATTHPSLTMLFPSAPRITPVSSSMDTTPITR